MKEKIKKKQKTRQLFSKKIRQQLKQEFPVFAFDRIWLAVLLLVLGLS